MNKFVTSLPRYLLVSPCDRYAALDQFDWVHYVDDQKVPHRCFVAMLRRYKLTANFEIYSHYGKAPQLPTSVNESSSLVVDLMSRYKMS